MSDEKTSGISRAIAIAGNQAALSKLIWQKHRILIWQARISDYERAGGVVSEDRARLIADVTGVLLADLLLPRKKRQHRRASGRKAPASV